MNARKRTKKSQAQEEPKTYALVLYDDKTTGVIRTETIALRARKRGHCTTVTAPIDWPEDKKKYRGKIVEFGNSTDYLHSLNVSTEGKVLTGVLSDSALAQKRALQQQAGAATSEKRGQNEELAAFVSHLLPIHDEEGEPSDADNEVPELMPSDPENPTDENAVVGEVLTARETLSHHLDGICGDSDQCQLMSILKAASPENMAFLRSVCKAAQQHTSPTTKSGDKENEASSLPSLEWETLECFKPGDLKFPLVLNSKVFVSKQDFTSIPPIRTKQKQIEEKSQNSLTPRAAVNYLLRLLIPENILKTLTAKAINVDLKTAIKGYINMRLPESARIKDAQLSQMISEYTRGLRRDRTSDFLKRESMNAQLRLLKERNQNAVPSTSQS